MASFVLALREFHPRVSNLEIYRIFELVQDLSINFGLVAFVVIESKSTYFLQVKHAYLDIVLRGGG